MITYRKPNSGARVQSQMLVLLDGKHVGDIMMEKDASGYFYKPLGSKRGATFDRIRDVQASLEGDE